MTRFFIIMAGCAAVLAAPLAAQPAAAPPAAAAAAAAAAAPARVSIPFNPPLDRPLRYRATVTKPRGGRAVAVWFDYELRFTRRPEGFRLAVRVTDAGSADMPGIPPAMIRQTIAGLILPYALLLDARGTIEGMEDQEAYWNRMLALTEQAIRQSARTGQPTDEAALSQVMQGMRETPPQAQLVATTEHIAPILQFGGGDFTLGESRTGEEQVEGLMGIRVRQRSEIRAERVENGRLRLTTRATVPQEDMRRAVESFMARIPVTGQGHNNAAERERGMAQLRSARFERESNYTYEVGLDSGLVLSGGGADRTILEMGGDRREQTQSYRIERRD